MTKTADMHLRPPQADLGFRVHFGSRNSVKLRFQLMLGFTGAVRTDISELIMPHRTCPIRKSDSLLRKMVQDKNMLPETV